MNFPPSQQLPPTPPTRPNRRKKPLLIGTIAVSWCLIAASALTIVLNRDSDDTVLTANDADSETTAAPAEETVAAPLADELEQLENAFAEGDRDAWTALFSERSVDRGGRYFDNLTALQAAAVELRTIREVTESGTGHSAEIGLSFCLNPPDAADCTRTEVSYQTGWVRGGDGLVLDHIMDSFGHYRPHAWEEVELTVAVGDRAIVAVDAETGVDPADYLDTAESAAAAADEFALLAPVDSYLVVLATDDQFNTWYGGYDHGISLGYAASTTTDAEKSEIAGPVHVVIPYDRHDTAGIGKTFRHELGHAATLQGSDLREAGNEEGWWAMEGIAEYIAVGDTIPADRVSDTASLAADGGCANGIEPLSASDSATVGSGKYGCAYLGVRYLIEEYGIEAFMDWFQAVRHRGSTAAAASLEHFGTDHAELLAAVGTYIDNAV